MTLVLRPSGIRCFNCTFLSFLFVLPSNNAGRGLRVVIRHAVNRRLRVLGGGTRLTPRLQGILTLSKYRPVARRFNLANDRVRLTVRNFRRANLTKTRFARRVGRLPLIRLRVGFTRRARFLLVCLCVNVIGRYFIRRSLYLVYGSHTESSVQCPLRIDGAVE